MEAQENPVAQQLLHAFMGLRRANWRHKSIAGLTHNEMIVMSCIKRASLEDSAGIRVSDIGSRLEVASPTITQQITELENRGFVEKHSDIDDRRAVRVRLTGKGDVAIKTAWDAFLASFQGLADYLGEEESQTLAELLTKASMYFHETREAS